MPRSVATAVENNFTRGLITEATGLNFPENACTDSLNCVFDKTGKVSRRYGFEYEPGNEFLTVSRQNAVTVAYLWKDVNGDGSVSFVVLQVGGTLYFYQVQGTDPISAGEHADTITLSTFASGVGAIINTVACQFSSGNGLLFVTHPNLETFYVEYDADLDSIDGVQINLSIRDVEGDTADALADDTRPTSTLAGLTDAHEYNLRNQGWDTTNLTDWDTANTTMPSNCDIAWYFKNASDEFDFSSTRIADVYVGNSPAPKGHFVLDLYDQDRAAIVTGATSLDMGLERVSTSAFFVGRLFYSGLSFKGQNSKIFFTQIVEKEDQYGKCYQRNDPTSETLFDLLPNDGGVINIQNAGTIIRLFPIHNHLLVFASNGTWGLTGSEGIGFTATDYTVTKLSNIGAISASSFVEVEGIPIWWNDKGIYTIQASDSVSTPQVVSISENTIQEFFDAIPLNSRKLAVGAYNSDTKIAQWLYKSVNTGSVDEDYEFDRILTLDTTSGAFSPWSVEADTVTINGIVVIEGVGNQITSFNVVDDGVDNIVDNTTDQVVVFDYANQSVSPAFKYVVSVPNGSNHDITFADNSDATYLDFTQEDGGVNYESYFTTGYKLHGDAQRKFQANYIWLYCDNDTPSVFSIQGRWDYATSSDTGRWSVPQIITFTTASYSHRIAKRKIRGHGKVLQFRVDSQEGEPFDIVGWSVFETGNQLP